MASTVPLLSLNDGRRLGQFANYFQVDSTIFQPILNKVGPLISKQHTSTEGTDSYEIATGNHAEILGHRAVYDRPTLQIQARYEIYS